MTKIIKRLIIKTLGLKNYLRFLQRTYFLLYSTGVLKYNSSYEYHYFVKHLIDEGDVIIDIGANLGYFSFLFAKWAGKSGRIYAFEPVAVYNEVIKERVNRYNNIQIYPSETQIKTLSALFGNFDRINYLKCSIEGYEYTILSDMKEIIRKCKPIVQVGVSPDNEEKILELFDELGYTPYKLYKYQLVPQSEDYVTLPGDYIFIVDSNPEQ